MNLSFNYLSSNFHPFESSIPKLLLQISDRTKNQRQSNIFRKLLRNLKFLFSRNSTRSLFFSLITTYSFLLEHVIFFFFFRWGRRTTGIIRGCLVESRKRGPKRIGHNDASPDSAEESHIHSCIY